MDPFKIVVTGPVCAGKTTFIRTLSEDGIVSTEEQTTDAIEKDTTTVGLELGRVTVQGRATRLFGTPGQERFDYLWDIVAEGAEGCVLLCPADRPTTCDRSLAFVRRLAREEGVPSVVGLTRCDLIPAEPTELRTRLAPAGSAVSCLDARDHGDCESLLTDLVHTISE
jgi:small GTP-binding protein